MGIKDTTAFPIRLDHRSYAGQTLLDYFAGQALTGLSNQFSGDMQVCARKCYDMAEEMLKERARRHDKYPGLQIYQENQ